MTEDEEGADLGLDAARKLVDAVPHWHHRFEIYPGLMTPGSYDPLLLWSKLDLENRCHGQRVLDLVPHRHQVVLSSWPDGVVPIAWAVLEPRPRRAASPRTQR